MSLTPEQVQIIKSTVPILQEHGAVITSSFYGTLLHEHPELNNLFNQANQRNKHQPQALAGALYAYASNIDDLGVLAPAIEKICQKHASLYIRPAQYEIVGTYLLRAMGDVLGSALTPEILEAWRVAYWQLAHVLINREDELFQAAGSWDDWRDFRIADKVKESDVITSFYLEPVDGRKLPSFLPGQYVSILTDVPDFGYLQSRQYSLSDAPNEQYYRVSIKKEEGVSAKAGEAPHPGIISNIMHDHKKVGDVVKMSHPAGEFFLDPKKDTDGPVVLISAGVGLTPMISILNALLRKGSDDQRISFIHVSRTTKVQAFRQHIKVIVKQHPNVTASIFIRNPDTATDTEGLDYKHARRLSLDLLCRDKDLALDHQKTKYLVCGPGGFMADVHDALRGLGVDEERIRMELFGTGAVPTAPKTEMNGEASDE